MTARRVDEGRQIRHVAIHAVVPLDDEQRVPVTRAYLAEDAVGGCGIEMRERHTAGAGQNCALDDAVVDQCVVHDHVIATEQLPDHGNVGRMAADQSDAILGAVHVRQLQLELAVHRAFARHRPACRD